MVAARRVPTRNGGIRLAGNCVDCGCRTTIRSGSFQKTGGFGRSSSKRNRGRRDRGQRGSGWAAAIPIAFRILGSLQGGKGRQNGGNIFKKAKSFMKKGKGVYNKGIRGVNKAFNSKAGQMAINIGAQLADMPAIRNSKYGKHLNKSLNGLNKVRDFAAKQSGSELIFGTNSPFNGIPVLGDIL